VQISIYNILFSTIRFERNQKLKLMPDQIHSERLVHIFNNDLELLKVSMQEFKEKTNYK
jgi:hypothetical protein